MEDPAQSPLFAIFSKHASDTNLLTSNDVVSSYLQDINDKLMETQRQIHDIVSQNSTEFTNTLNYCKDFKTQAASLNDQLSSITDKIAHPEKGLYAELVTAITNYHELQEEIHSNQSSITLLENIYSHYTTLSSYDNLYSTRDYTQAATLLTKAPEVQVGSLRIYAVLADEYRTRKNTLKKVLQEALRNAVQSSSVSSNKRSGNILDKSTLQIHQSVASMLQAIESLGDKEYTAAFSYLHKVTGEFFSFLLSDPSNIASFNQQNNEWSLVVEAGSKKLEHLPVPVVLQILSTCEQGLNIVAKHLFEDNVSFITKMGSLIWDDIVSNMIKNILATSIPEDNSQLAEYKEVLSAIENLEQSVHRMGYITPEHPKFSAMSKYAHDVDTHFALKKQRRLLSKARKLLINADHNLTFTVGTPEPMPDMTKLTMNKKPTTTKKTEENNEEELFLKLSTLPQCVVSSAAHSLVSLMHLALQAPLLSESRSLYNNGMVIRSIVDLFRVVYSSHHKHKLADVPQLSMVFHNDCFYIAQYISLMLQADDKQNTDISSFVDLIHSLRELGESSWLKAITKQIEQVNESIGEMGGLADTQEAKRKHTVERGLKILALQLKSIGDTWRGVLPSHLFFTTLGILVNHLFSTLVRELELVEAIAEEECHILHALLKQIYQQGEAVFKASNDRLTQHLLNKYVPEHTKLSKAIDLLEMPLVKIVEYYRNGLLDEFSARELKNFIMCLFSDSPLRRQLLDQLVVDSPKIK